MFSCEFCKVFKNSFFIENLRWLLLVTFNRGVEFFWNPTPTNKHGKVLFIHLHFVYSWQQLITDYKKFLKVDLKIVLVKLIKKRRKDTIININTSRALTYETQCKNKIWKYMIEIWYNDKLIYFRKQDESYFGTGFGS